jgi:uncharacterized protein (TIGR02271 family)
MTWSQETAPIAPGDEVFGSDNEKVGTVAEVQPGYLVVEKGFFFPTDFYIPLSAVTLAEAGQVYLMVTKDAALHSGWDVVPDLTATTDAQVVERDRIAGEPEMAAYEVAADDDLIIPVREEELSATVHEREAGAVRVEKRVVSEDRVLNVPVTEEQIRVERRIVDRSMGAADADAFEEIVIEVPLTAEEVELRKQARVVEEVVVSKEAIQHTEQVAGTVRREEVVIDEDTVATDVRADRSGEQAL